MGRQESPALRGKIRLDQNLLVWGTWLKPAATFGCCMAGGEVTFAGSNEVTGGYGRWPTGVAWLTGKLVMVSKLLVTEPRPTWATPELAAAESEAVTFGPVAPDPRAAGATTWKTGAGGEVSFVIATPPRSRN